MNKIMKNSLLIYMSLTLILVGMAFSAYAITATDADQYITRSQYSVYISELSTLLDETESNLFGKINKYRTTDVKFVTWDTPNKYYNTQGSDGGYYSGGNYFLRKRINPNAWQYSWGYSAGNRGNKTNGRYTDFSIYRLWNGNYYLGKTLTYITTDTNPIYYSATVNYAVPVENFPGWYLEIRPWAIYNSTEALVSLVKLDPNAPVTPTTSDTLHLRFKKDLFDYAGSATPVFTTTKKSWNTTVSYWSNTSYNQPFTYTYNQQETRTGTVALSAQTWIEEETGDYLCELKNMTPSAPTTSNYTVYFSGTTNAISALVPKDNVEYVCGNTIGIVNVDAYYAGVIPLARRIGTGDSNDAYWEYEFVDNPNGLKYWHAYRKARTAYPPGITGGFVYPYGVHYSLPIVY